MAANRNPAGANGGASGGDVHAAKLNSPEAKASPTTNQVAYYLYYGNSRAPLARVLPHARYVGMWRIAWPDGRVSDIVNLARAKDAAMAWGERNTPGKDRNRLGWKKKPRKTPVEAPSVRFSSQPAPTLPTALPASMQDTP
jgi:hypothetical protein